MYDNHTHQENITSNSNILYKVFNRVRCSRNRVSQDSSNTTVLIGVF